MRFENLTWFDVENYLEEEDRLILVLGACEQHAYLSLLTDLKIPLALAEEACQRSGVLLAPPLSFGVSPYFQAYPGTLSLRVSTFLDMVEDLVRSAYQQGFRRILILNGHGGNEVVRDKLSELVNELGGLRMAWHSWWAADCLHEIAEKHGLVFNHANWSEAFSFTQVTDLPDGKKDPVHIPGLISAEEVRDICGDGSFGGEYRAEESILDEIFAAALEEVLAKLRFD